MLNTRGKGILGRGNSIVKGLAVWERMDIGKKLLKPEHARWTVRMEKRCQKLSKRP